MPGYENKRYFASTAVLLNEILKLLLSTVVSYRECKSPREIWNQTFSSDSWKLMIPAALYTVYCSENSSDIEIKLQNNLQYLAVSNLSAATFQVTYQLKILTTALFSVTMLHRSLSKLKWISLVVLTLGVALCQLPAGTFLPSQGDPTGLGDEDEADLLPPNQPDMDQFVGLVTVLTACTISGIAGVYFEKVLKGSQTSLWIRNIQLSFYSLFPALLLGVIAKDGGEIVENGFFYGYNAAVWFAIFCQAFGGILVALCVAYADNIMKGFATSISILISFAASVYLFEFKVTVNFLIGALLVLAATYMYSLPDQQKERYESLPMTEDVNHTTQPVDQPK
ncbi:UDP-galactose transporter [Neolecta irregularis DAH-3]|uniref:UDP-galactose transporter n=1 Tax=Neolecta irregularis (strain DAH-3) TaxID=1198029 RepID=A0A1U7LHE1_NEOID|nr:UDP-galactose transporter [Neolecta irregularis DAH-3]|eukprot:OLL22076.1 UDP-galactose transporter [Neolecta irregularis DAH-3]